MEVTRTAHSTDLDPPLSYACSSDMIPRLWTCLAGWMQQSPMITEGETYIFRKPFLVPQSSSVLLSLSSSTLGFIYVRISDTYSSKRNMAFSIRSLSSKEDINLGVISIGMIFQAMLPDDICGRGRIHGIGDRVPHGAWSTPKRKSAGLGRRAVDLHRSTAAT